MRLREPRSTYGWLAAACVVQALSCSRSSEPTVRSEAGGGSVVARAATTTTAIATFVKRSGRLRVSAATATGGVAREGRGR